MTATAVEEICTCAGMTYELREDDLGLFRWYHADGAPTSIYGSTVAQARRAMMLGGASLAKAGL